MTEGQLAGRVAVVTGAGQGMGRAITQRLAAEGAKVAALDLNLEQAQESVAGCVDPSVCEAYVCNVSDSGAVNEVFATVESALGPVSILVNNAGIERAPVMVLIKCTS